MKRLFFLLLILQASLFTTSMSAQDSYLTVSTTSLRYSSGASTQKFTITSNVDWTISVEGGDGWVSVSPTSGRGVQDVSVHKSDTNDPNGGPYHAIITVVGDGLTPTVEVWAPWSHYLTVDTSHLDFNYNGGIQTFSITSNRDWNISVEGGTGWLTVTPQSGNGNGEITVSATANTGSTPRNATITVTGDGISKTVEVYQAGSGYLTTNVINLRFNPYGGTQTFNIASNVEWTISVEGGDGWLTVSPMSGSGNQVITVKAEESDGYFSSPHYATIIISCGYLTQTISVYQTSSPYLTVSTTEILFNSEESTQKFAISSNIVWTISIEGGEDWLYVSSDNGVGNADITIQVSANNSFSTRQATITVSGQGLSQVITVQQYSSTPPPHSEQVLRFNPNSSRQAVNVYFFEDSEITVDGGEGWLTINPLSGNGWTELIIAVSMNDEGSPRLATLIITGGGMTQTIKIYQDGTSYLVVSTTSLVYNPTGGRQMFDILSNVSWTISIEGGDGWLSVSPMSGTGNQEVLVTAEKYREQYPMPHYNATITIAGEGQTQIVRAVLMGDFFVLSSDSLLFDNYGGTQMLGIASRSPIELTIENGVGWLSVDLVNDDGVNRDYSITATGNIGSANREATIIAESIYGWNLRIARIAITQSGTDDVQDITMQSNDIQIGKNALYDLSGRRTVCTSKDVGKLRQGVYIFNGKKIVIR